MSRGEETGNHPGRMVPAERFSTMDFYAGAAPDRSVLDRRGDIQGEQAISLATYKRGGRLGRPLTRPLTDRKIQKRRVILTGGELEGY